MFGDYGCHGDTNFLPQPLGWRFAAKRTCHEEGKREEFINYLSPLYRSPSRPNLLSRSAVCTCTWLVSHLVFPTQKKYTANQSCNRNSLITRTPPGCEKKNYSISNIVGRLQWWGKRCRIISLKETNSKFVTTESDFVFGRGMFRTELIGR